MVKGLFCIGGNCKGNGVGIGCEIVVDFDVEFECFNSVEFY